MNLYFLVEGLSECEFYPKFVEFYFGELLSKVDYPTDAISNNYFLIGNGGYPFIYTGPKYPVASAGALKNAILDINSNPVYDYLIICLDADELSLEEKIHEFDGYVKKYVNEGVVLNNYCEFKLIIQNRCIETWFLGNKKMFKRNPSSEPLVSYTRYFDVSTNDPELMGNYRDEFSHQDFHLQYLRAMIREKTRMAYKKESPLHVVDNDYMERMYMRVSDKNNHLKSLSNLIDLFDYAKERIINA